MLSRKAVISFVVAVVVLGGTLTYSSIQKSNLINRVCNSNEVQDNILENLLGNAEAAATEQIGKEVKEGKKPEYSLKKLKEFYAPTYRELEENNDC
jgi:hypothetical protein